MMVWNNPPKLEPDELKKSKNITPEQLAASGTEHGNQAALFCWAALNVGKYPSLKFMFAIPNGGLRDVRVAASLKAEGVKAGVPDIFLPCPIQTRSGCFIEMKIGRNKPTLEQNEYRIFLQSYGYYWECCYSWEGARDTLIAYLEGRI